MRGLRLINCDAVQQKVAKDADCEHWLHTKTAKQGHKKE